MNGFAWLVEGMSALMDKGGVVMWAILAATVLMWTLIIERFYYIYVSYPRERDALIAAWTARCKHRGWKARKIRELRLAEADGRLQRGFSLMRALMAVLPMLGLLGTIAGMMNTFDVMAVFGTGNARGMAGGISQALITTMAGLVTALSGLYFVHHLGHRADVMRQALADQLNIQ
jgi:biopolymer transport protein ExbB